MKDYKKIRTGNYNIDKIQDNLTQYLNQFDGLFILDGILHKDIEINTSFALEHKLGRLPIGYIVIKKDTNAIIYNGDITVALLNLSSSASVTADIWVF